MSRGMVAASANPRSASTPIPGLSRHLLLVSYLMGDALFSIHPPLLRKTTSASRFF